MCAFSDESSLHKLRDGLAHRRARHAEPRCQSRFFQGISGREVAVKDIALDGEADCAGGRGIFVCHD